MASDFFIEKSFKKKIEKDIKKREDIEKKIKVLQQKLKDTNEEIDKDLKNFYLKADNTTILASIDYIESLGGKQKEFAEELKLRNETSSLMIEDTLTIIDWYEVMCKHFNNKN